MPIGGERGELNRGQGQTYQIRAWELRYHRRQTSLRFKRCTADILGALIVAGSNNMYFMVVKVDYYI